MGDFDTLYGNLDGDPRKRGRQFEHVAKWFLATDPVYSHELRHVWLWDEWPGRWAADAGIDLVAEDRNGDLWAIQAKAYNPKYRVSKKDVDKFLAESGRAVFTYRMLIATTDLIDRIGERTVQDQEKRATFFRLNDLRAAGVDWPNSPAKLRPARRPPPARPRKHQGEAIRDVVSGFGDADRGQLIMACGTGKTLTGLFITEKLAATRTLVLVPSLSLLKQTLNVWRANCTTEFASLPVCSDDTVGAADDDRAVAHTTDIGVPVTTDPERIAAFLRQRSGPRVVFGTYQSSPQIAKAFGLGRVPKFDLLLADEAHRCAGPVSSAFGTVFNPAAIKADRRLFMTATPRYFTGRVRKAAQDADYEIASMDDEAKFGPVFHRLTFGEAIERDLLSDYQVVIVGVDDDTYREWAEKGTLVSRDGVERLSAATLAGQIGLAKGMKRYDLRRVISFHSRVSRARQFSASMPDVLAWMPARQRPQGKLWSRFASGEMPTGDRYVLLQHLGRLDDGDRGLLSNARCLAEGVDVPTLDGVAFIDPRRSEVDIVQAVGRAIRKSEEKTVGTIVIPVFIDTEADPQAALDSSVFKPVWDVIKALRAHDAELGEQLDDLRRELGREGGKPKLPDKIHTDIPTSVGPDFARAFDVRLVEQTTLSWEFWFGMLEKYVAEHGTALVRGREIYEGQRLGQWVIIQRTKWETLSEDRRTRLSNLSGWTTDVHDTQWEEGFRHLEDYIAQNGDSRVRDDYVDQDGYRLGKWVGKQRTKWEKLTEDQRYRLRKLPGWIRDVRMARWEEGFNQLQEYAVRHGDTSPAKEGLFNGYRLGQWVAAERSAWGSLTEERQKRLQALPGWTLNTLDDKWDRSFRHLEEYVSELGHANVPQDYFTPDSYGLGKWVSVQRAKWDSLGEERRRRLEQLSGWTLDARGVWWEEGFGHLQDYVNEHGTALLRQNVIYDGYALGQWVSNQKTRWSTLSTERKKRLGRLPGWAMDARSARWEEGYAHIQDYAKTHGTARLPSNKYIHDGFKLGIWVNTQRQNWSTLGEGRRKRLAALPDWTENTHKALWEEGFGYLCSYVEQRGDAMVSSGCIFEGFRLGQWVTVQRRNWEKLDDDRRKRLSDLPEWALSARDSWWEEGFRRLQQYAQRHGEASPPQRYADEDGYKLGTWVNKQRQTELAGELQSARQKRLAALPGWEWTPRESRWDEGFRRLRSYMNEHRNLYPPQSYVADDDYRLGAWVNQQRQKGLAGTLEPDLFGRLDRLPGWRWSPRDESWARGFERLKAYAKRKGHCGPPQSYIADDGYRLGAWVSQQRQKFRAGALSPEQAEQLSHLRGWEWSPPRGRAASKG